MNKLETLIHNFCPDGVEFCTFKEVMKYEQPTKYIVKNTDYNDSFETPFPNLFLLHRVVALTLF